MRTDLLNNDEEIKKHLGVSPIWFDDLIVIGIFTETQLSIISKKKRIKFVELSLNEFKKLLIVDKRNIETYQWKKGYGYNKKLFWKAFNLATLLRGKQGYEKMKFLLPKREKDFLMFINAFNGHKKFYVCIAPRILEESEKGII